MEITEIARRQLRVGFGGPYALDWTVLARLADDAGIETDGEWWMLVSIVEGELIAALNPPTPPGGTPDGGEGS
jgi:hypothetical protein